MSKPSANMLLGRTVERGKNTCPCTVLKGKYASGTAPDRFMQVKEHAVKPAATVEGDMCAGASTAGHRGCLTAGTAMWAHSSAAADCIRLNAFS